MKKSRYTEEQIIGILKQAGGPGLPVTPLRWVAGGPGLPVEPQKRVPHVSLLRHGFARWAPSLRATDHSAHMRFSLSWRTFTAT